MVRTSNSGTFCLHVSLNEFSCDGLYDAVSVTAHSQKMLGRPISQRANSGFNRTELFVFALGPFGSFPESVDFFWRCENRQFSTGRSITAAILGSWSIRFRPSAAYSAIPGVSFQSRADGVTYPAFGLVGDEVESLADVRRAEARSAEIESPEGVSLFFHVRLYKVEPRKSVRRRNLLSKDDIRIVLRDEAEPYRPEVSFVFEAFLATGGRERLTRARAGPNLTVFRPSGVLEGEGPRPDSSKEVALAVSSKIIGRNLSNGAGVYISFRQDTSSDQSPHPIGGVFLDFVVVDRHQALMGAFPGFCLQMRSNSFTNT